MLPHVFFAIPKAGQLHEAMIYCLDRLEADWRARGGKSTRRVEPRGSLPVAHSLLASAFLESDADRLFIIHSDVSQFTTEDVARMACSPHDVIAGAVPSRSFEYERIDRAIVAGVDSKELARHGTMQLWWELEAGNARVEHGALEIAATCPAFLCVSRAAIERVVSHDRAAREARGMPRRTRWEDIDFDHVFAERETPEGHQSEDRSFCMLWRSLGGRVWLDLDTDLVHWGTMPFRGRRIRDVVRTRKLGAKRSIPFRGPPLDLVCPQSCEPCAREIAGGVYDVDVRFAEPPFVLDLGANVGAFARWAMMKWPGALVECHEPASGEVLEALHANAVHGMTVCNDAIVSRDGVELVDFYEREDATGSSLAPRRDGETPRQVEAMDAANLPPCDVFKIDIEGNEPAVLDRYLHTGHEPPRVVLAEWHDAPARIALREILRSRGYTIERERPSRMEGEVQGVMVALR